MKPDKAPEIITHELVQQVYGAVGNLRGWDFLRVNTVSEPHPWEYKGIVKAYLKPTDRVLDVGTGSGELFLSLAHCFREGVAADHSPSGYYGTCKQGDGRQLQRQVSSNGCESVGLPTRVVRSGADID